MITFFSHQSTHHTVDAPGGSGNMQLSTHSSQIPRILRFLITPNPFASSMDRTEKLMDRTMPMKDSGFPWGGVSSRVGGEKGINYGTCESHTGRQRN